MEFQKLEVSERVAQLNRGVDHVLNRAIRSFDGIKAKVRVGGRRANYDDERYEFHGGPGERMRAKHYDKSLRLLWKAEEHAPFLPFKDSTEAERSLRDMALRSLSDEERAERKRLISPEYRGKCRFHMSKFRWLSYLTTP